MISFPNLETPRLRLRQLATYDAPELFRYFSQEIVMKYYDLPVFTKMEEAVQIINHWNRRYVNREGIRWALTRKDSGMAIGTCGYHNWQKDHFKAEMGYDLSPEYWNKGYMTEAVQAIIRYGFQAMNLNRIEAYTDPENIGSIKLLLKAGLQKEGLLREFFFEKNQFFDGVVFAILKKDYMGRQTVNDVKQNILIT